MIVQYVMLTLLICIAFYTDVRTMKIPNSLTASVTVFALVLHCVRDGWAGGVYSLIGCGAGLGILMILYIFKAIGAGDVKLFGALGALMGLEFTLYSMMYSVLYAGIIGVIVLLLRQQFIIRVINMIHYLLWIVIRRSLSSFDYAKEHPVLTFPFMYAVLPAIVTSGILLI